MSTIMTYVSPEQKKLMDKVEKVILSCKTKDQLERAFNYYMLWSTKEYWGLDIMKNLTLNTKAWYFLGIMQGMLKFAKWTEKPI